MRVETINERVNRYAATEDYCHVNTADFRLFTEANRYVITAVLRHVSTVIDGNSI